VVAAAALGDVVEEGGEVEHLGRSNSCISCDRNGYSWSKRGMRKRRRLRITMRMCSSTV
jgi:hypothetical protein